jgi:hypothetical protein
MQALASHLRARYYRYQLPMFWNLYMAITQSRSWSQASAALVLCLVEGDASNT